MIIVFSTEEHSSSPGQTQVDTTTCISVYTVLYIRICKIVENIVPRGCKIIEKEFFSILKFRDTLPL